MPRKPRLGSGKRFKRFTSKLRGEGYSKESAGRIAAAAGRKKWGRKRMSRMASTGRRRSERG